MEKSTSCQCKVCGAVGIVSVGIVVAAGAGIMLGPVIPATVVAMVPAEIVTAASMHAGSILLAGGIYRMCYFCTWCILL